MARELNFSSDIDLVPLYLESGETDGARPISNQEFFTRLVQQLIRLLEQHTEDGFVFRVDLRLRPFGDSGPGGLECRGARGLPADARPRLGALRLGQGARGHARQPATASCSRPRSGRSCIGATSTLACSNRCAR